MIFMTIFMLYGAHRHIILNSPSSSYEDVRDSIQTLHRVRGDLESDDLEEMFCENICLTF